MKLRADIRGGPRARPVAARALLYGFLFGGSVLLSVPGQPYVGLALLGVYVALVLHGAPGAYAVGAGLGAAIYVLAGGRVSHPLPDPLGFVALILAPVGVLVAQVLLDRVSLRRLIYAMVGVLCVSFIIQGALHYPVSLGREPQPETYDYDPYFFMRVYYLVDAHDMGFYEAWGQAVRDDARFDQPVANLAGWRNPVLTRLWTTLFRSGDQIIAAFLVLATLSLGVGFAVAARLSDPLTALVVPALLVEYYLASLETLHFLAYEVWAGFFALGALALVTLRRDKAGLLFATAAAAIREWFVSVLIGGILTHVSRRRWRDAVLWGASLFLVIGLYGLNLWLAWRYLQSAGVETSSGTAGRLGLGGPLFILYTLQFNAAFFAHEYVLPYLVFFLGLVGCAALIRSRDYYLPTLVLVPLGFFMLTGSGHVPGDPYGMDVYYSGAFLPFAMIAACCAGQIFASGRSRRKPGGGSR